MFISFQSEQGFTLLETQGTQTPFEVIKELKGTFKKIRYISTSIWGEH